MKNVFITGGSRGIGRAMVLLFTSHGYKVGFTYLASEVEAERLSAETGALAIRADNRSEQDMRRAVDYYRENIGNVEILINNAAVYVSGLVTDMTLAQWRDVFSVNVDAAFYYSREVISPMIRSGGGRIINISSMWGITGASCEVAYSASKAALIGMTKALAKELGPSAITVNAIAPGLIDTEMNAGYTKEELSAIEEETPLMRMGRAEEIAEVALFLASDASSFVTGAVINASGGLVT